MNTKSTGYGIDDTSRRIARRVKRERDQAEMVDRPQMRPTQAPAPVRTEKRPLAA